MKEISAGQIYRHFKGNIYEIIVIAVHTESEEELVIYRDRNHPEKVWARPKSMFVEKVDREKYPDVEQEYRFERIK